jgi:hypothetical protein
MMVILLVSAASLRRVETYLSKVTTCFRFVFLPVMSFRMFLRQTSEPKRVEISVWFRIISSISSPSVSYRGTVVTSIKFDARSVTIHSSLLAEQMPTTYMSSIKSVSFTVYARFSFLIALAIICVSV